MRKYSDKFLYEHNKLKIAKIGFELEFYLSDLSFYKTLEILNQELSPCRVHGFRSYHSDFKPDESDDNYLKLYSILNIILSILENTISNAGPICDSINGELKGKSMDGHTEP